MVLTHTPIWHVNLDITIAGGVPGSGCIGCSNVTWAIITSLGYNPKTTSRAEGEGENSKDLSWPRIRGDLLALQRNGTPFPLLIPGAPLDRGALLGVAHEKVGFCHETRQGPNIPFCRENKL